MSQSLSNVIIHVIFSTKDRVNYLDNKIKDRIHAYIATIIRDMDGNAFRDGQEEHHKKTTFKEEFIRFLKKYNVPYDEKYVWE